MIIPVTFVMTFLAIATALAWWSISRIAVTPQQVAMMAQRIPFPGGIRVCDVERALIGIAKLDEIVIPFDRATLLIAYPLTVPANVPITAALSHGFTRGELVRTICEEYANVYEAEEATSAIAPAPPEERTRPERNRTDGVYGIWGHDLEDLVLTAVRWTRGRDGLVTIELHIEAHPHGTSSPSASS